MMKKVIIYVFIGMVIALLAIWLYAGGYVAVKNFVRTLSSPLDIFSGNATSTYKVTLPWEIDIPQGPDISGLLEDDGDYTSDQSAPSGGGTTAAPAPNTTPTQTTSTRSPYIGQIAISAYTISQDPRGEYLVVNANPANRSPVVISGWSLQSGQSGTRAFIPQAATPYMPGGTNRVGPIVLSPGGSVIIQSAISPVGVSFQDNSCTGYITTSPADTANYSNCMQMSPPAQNSWHAYFGFTQHLWGASDTINLIDGSGYVVNTISY